MFVIAMLFTPLRDWIQRILDKRFFHGTLESLDMERQKLQQQLFQTEKLAYVGQLASSVVHEIRNPLTAIKTYVEYFSQKKNDPEYAQKFETLIPNEINRIEKVVHSLLDLAKPRKPVMREASISEIVKNTLELLAESLKLKHIQVKTDFQVKDDKITCDKEQIQQVMLNLILNSLQAMEEGGEIVVRIQGSGVGDQGSSEPLSNATSNSSDETTLTPNPRPLTPNKITITITDTGSGISEAQLQKLFTPFATTKEKGIGLGLVITKEIIEQHGGRIGVESEEDVGTTFTIELKRE